MSAARIIVHGDDIKISTQEFNVTKLYPALYPDGDNRRFLAGGPSRDEHVSYIRKLKTDMMFNCINENPMAKECLVA